MTEHLPQLPKHFWSYLQGLEREIDGLLELLEEERLCLLGKDFKGIMGFARKKEEALRRISHGEERLSNIIGKIIQKAGIEGEEAKDTLKAFKSILDFKDFLRFDAWLSSYLQKRQDVYQMNFRNLKWAESGLKETLELTRIFMGGLVDGSRKGVGSSCLYDKEGRIQGGL